MSQQLHGPPSIDEEYTSPHSIGYSFTHISRMYYCEAACRCHRQHDTFGNRKLYQGYDQDKTPSDEPEDENCSHKHLLAEMLVYSYFRDVLLRGSLQMLSTYPHQLYFRGMAVTEGICSITAVAKLWCSCRYPQPPLDWPSLQVSGIIVFLYRTSGIQK